MNIHFAYPLWLALGAAAALILFLALHKNEKRRQLALERFSTPRLSPQLLRNISRRRRLLKNILAALALFCAFVAVARPRYGYRIEEVKRRGIDILFAVDTSRSMLAEDVRPNRLTRAKLAIYDFVHQLNGDRVGLLPFAGDSWLMCPLTLDYAAFDQSLESIDTAIIPRGGTNIAAVIDRAVSILGTGSNHRILLLITDGENLEGDVVAAAESAAKAGLTIYTVGVGTESGELIPLADGRGVVRNRAGEPVRSKLDVAVLTKTAAATGGIYTPLGSEGLESIYRQKLARVPKAELSSRHRRVAAERFQWPLAAALLLLIVEFLISDRSREKARHHKSTAGVAALLLISFLTVTEAVATATTATSSTADSDVLFRPASDEPKQPLLFYNHGTALYKNGDYDKAIANFTRTLESRDLNLQAKAYYNRGCALFQKGAQVKNDPQTTIDNWEQAVKSFASAATINPEDSSAAANRDWVQKQLQTLKQQQEKAQKEKEKRKQSAADSETQQKNTAEKKRSETKKQNAKDTAADKKEKTEAPPEKRQQAAGKQHKSQQQKGSATTADPASSSSEQRKPGAPQQTAQSATTQPGREQHQEKPASQSWLDRIRQQLEQLTQKKKAQQAAGKQHKPPQEKGSATSSTSDDSGSSGKHRQKEAPQKPAQSATTAPDNGQKKQDAAGITTESRQTADNRVQVPSQPGKENSRGQTIAAGLQSAELARAQQAEAEAAGREQAQIRRASGKMTREEALQILKAVKTETKTLRFVPGPSSGEPKESRDW